MDFTGLDASVLKHISLNPEELKRFHGLFKLAKLKRKAFAIKDGEICTFGGFVLKGCVRTYFVDYQGEEVNIAFATEGWWFGDLASLYEGSPSLTYIQALEDTEYLILEKSAQDWLYVHIPQFERFFRIIIQRNLVAMQQRLFATIAQPAQERYNVFVKQYPSLLQRIPQKHIASYLGISAEFLSKIRARRN